MNSPNVLLISMPWTSLVEPSLGLSILKTQLEQKQIQVRVWHANLLLLKYLKASTYLALANSYALNDFLFTGIFEPQPSARQLTQLTTIVESLLEEPLIKASNFTSADELQRSLLFIRNTIIPGYLDDCLEQIRLTKPTMVGFTCLFDQTIASVAFAKRIKQLYPDILVVMGGYALQGETGQLIIKSFPFIDVIAPGEGEPIIASLAQASVGQLDLSTIPGLLYRREHFSEEVCQTRQAPGWINLAQSPSPTYSDFEDDLRYLEMTHKVAINWSTLPIETSRGCWWGEVRHCVFCGIDDLSMKYRSKPVEQTLMMMADLQKKYQKNSFRITDYILPHQYFKTLLPALPDRSYQLSCEVKANMTESQMSALSQAGFREIQPGIESFSSAVLKRMDKGVKAIQNIFTLLLGARYGIDVHYNLLYGFPDDDPLDYEQMLILIPKLYHLIPPVSITSVAITRFAPLHMDPERFYPGKRLVYDKKYELIFSSAFRKKHGFALNEYCYYFRRPYRFSARLQHLYNMLHVQISHWKKIHQDYPVSLTYTLQKDGSIAFKDTRYDQTSETYTFEPKIAQLYMFCQKGIITFQQVEQEFSTLGAEELTTLLTWLEEHRLLYREGNKYIGLALSELETQERTNGSRKWASPYV